MTYAMAGLACIAEEVETNGRRTYVSPRYLMSPLSVT